MANRTPELRALLAEARAKASEALARDPVWRALQQRRADAARGTGPSSTQAYLAALEVELRSNPYLSVLGRIDEALALVAVADAAPDTTPPKRSATLGDDLTRIRGVTPAITETLARLGVTTFGQIAAWTASDVSAALAALGPGAAIHRQGWIEQAALLASRSTSNIQPAAPALQEPGAVFPLPPVVAASPTPSRPTDLDTVVASALRGIIDGMSVPDCIGGPTATLIAARGEQPGDRGPFEPAGRRTRDAAPAAAPPLSANAAPDDLELIAAIDEPTMRRLQAFGVTRFADIAGWTAADVVVNEVRLLQPLRIRREGWIEQAAILARGGMTAHAQARRKGLQFGLAAMPDGKPWLRQPLAQTWPVPLGSNPGPTDATATAASPPRATGLRAIPVSPALPIPRDALLAPTETLADGDHGASRSATAGLASLILPGPTVAASSRPAAQPAIAHSPMPAAAAPSHGTQSGKETSASAGGVAAATVSVPPTLVLPLPFAPAPSRVATVPSAALAAVTAPSAVPPAPAVSIEIAAAAASPRHAEPADRLENCGSDLAPGLAAALASAAAAAAALPDPHPGPRRRPLADSVTPLPPLISSVDMRQWRNDTEAELSAIADTIPTPAIPVGEIAEPRPAAGGFTEEYEDQPRFDDGEAEVVIVARTDGDAVDPDNMQRSDQPSPQPPPSPARLTGDGLTPAERIRARARRLPDVDEPDFSPETAGLLEEASVEIVVRTDDGQPLVSSSPPSDKTDQRGKGLSRLVKALKRETGPD